MAIRDTDKDWAYFGDTDPYWAVLTHDQFRKEKLTPQALADFFESGTTYVTFLLDTIRTHLDPAYRPASALDFGCGVGRVAVPLAQHCTTVVGIDISDGMLKEAESRCAAVGVSNVRLVKGDDELSYITETFDLIHSYIVFQHIPAPRGEAIVRRLVELLSDGGVGVLHLTYGKRDVPGSEKLQAFLRRLRRHPVRTVAALAGFNDKAQMQMHDYNLNVIFDILRKAGVRRTYVEFTDHAGWYGVLFFFKKQADDDYRA
jgi:SAM-dependent methyltransferase